MPGAKTAISRSIVTASPQDAQQIAQNNVEMAKVSNPSHHVVLWPTRALLGRCALIIPGEHAGHRCYIYVEIYIDILAKYSDMTRLAFQSMPRPS
jgi:hypothetical protein